LGDDLPEDISASEILYDRTDFFAMQQAAASHVADLTERQRQIMDMVLAGHPSKNIAADLGISQRTVENHRAKIMKKTRANSLPALARMAFAATWSPGLAL
jgi:two-component system CheB/CheR fusion protein